jgi:hypothetical protein
VEMVNDGPIIAFTRDTRVIWMTRGAHEWPAFQTVVLLFAFWPSPSSDIVCDACVLLADDARLDFCVDGIHERVWPPACITICTIHCVVFKTWSTTCYFVRISNAGTELLSVLRICTRIPLSYSGTQVVSVSSPHPDLILPSALTSPIYCNDTRKT